MAAKNYELIWRREYSLFYGVCCAYTLQRLVQDWFGATASVRSEGKEWITMEIEQGFIEQLRQRCREIIADQKKIRAELDLVYRELELFVTSCEQIARSGDDMMKRYRAFYAAYRRAFLVQWTSFLLPEAIPEMLQEKFGKEAGKVIEKYSQPSRKTGIIAIADYFSQEKGRQRRIMFIRKNYPFLQATDPFTQPLNVDWIGGFVDSFQHETVQEPRYTDDPLIKIYQELLYVKDWRDMMRRRGFYTTLPLLKEIARKKGITVKELGYLLPEELGKGYKDRIAERKKGFCVVLDSTLRITAGKADIEGKVFDAIVKGVVGCAGIVTGKVQVVMSKNDIQNFKKGNILVAITTNPDYIPAMHKAAAIVTDEGGIISHAAIVAREMKKPCVVGTKFATRMFKNGMMVEVDADKGMVRKAS